ncbi:hypothetical protein HPB47_002963 [Ixodes persulcatus]|uniref:Uncharacterized protein n=1 Tax=Ixodes persulcatus TaxID=34615 RepID=A0AC60PJU1_IXOPE|nr:hypothetical protein HPB47_002963 [Ixodes persulcatus]
MSEAGLSQRHISSKTNVSVVTVNRIIKAYRHEGRIYDAPRGRPPSYTALNEDLLIVAAAVDDPFMLKNRSGLSRSQKCERALNLNISTSTIRRWLWDAGLPCRIAAEKPRLYESHRRHRLLFAQEHVSWGYDKWNEVLFSDESSFTTCWDQKQYDPPYSEPLLHLILARVPEADRRLIIKLFQKGYSQQAIGALPQNGGEAPPGRGCHRHYSRILCIVGVDSALGASGFRVPHFPEEVQSVGTPAEEHPGSQDAGQALEEEAEEEQDADREASTSTQMPQPRARQATVRPRLPHRVPRQERWDEAAFSAVANKQRLLEANVGRDTRDERFQGQLTLTNP